MSALRDTGSLPLQYRRAPNPVHFPTAEEVPESKRHLEVRTLLYQFLKHAFARRASIGCDQFVYWDPTDPRACLAPDAFVRLGEPDHAFRSWKVWERGAPQLAVEVISDSDNSDADWDAKLEKYRRLGVSELVRFDPEAAERALRVWDSLQNDLVERVPSGPTFRSQVLPGYWVAVPDPDCGLALRLAQDENGTQLLPTPLEQEVEARRQEAETRRQEAEAERREAEAQRQAAEQRIRELEEELRRRS